MRASLMISGCLAVGLYGCDRKAATNATLADGLTTGMVLTSNGWRTPDDTGR